MKWTRHKALATCMMLPLFFNSVSLQAQPDPQAEFNRIADSIRQEAAEKGISAKTLNLAFANLSPVEGIARLESKQPEHKPGTPKREPTPEELKADFYAYYRKFVNPVNIEKGCALMAQHTGVLRKIQENSGVPPQYILAVFGAETKYGEFNGTFDILPALVTLARDGRTPERRKMFRNEAINALEILDQGYNEILTRKGSWAGAFGYTQFMPSSFLRLAADGDGDGRSDVWNSMPDAFASTANHLLNSNWKAGEIWGREVRIPAGFDKHLYTDNRRPGNQRIKTPAEWSRLGITLADGSPLPLNDGRNARIIEPGGPLGPHYIVYDNFMGALMDYNSSYKYALSVAMLADEIAEARSAPALSLNP